MFFIFIVNELSYLQTILLIMLIFIICITSIYFIYISIAFLNLHYSINKNELSIFFGIQKFLIPIKNIIKLEQFDLEEFEKKNRGIHFFKNFFGKTQINNDWALSFIIKNRKNQIVLVNTINKKYLISVKSYSEIRQLIAKYNILGAEKNTKEIKLNRINKLYKLFNRNYFNVMLFSIFSLITTLIIANQKLNKVPEIISANFPFKHFSNLPEYIHKDIIFDLYLILIIAFIVNIFLSFLITYFFNKGYKTIQFLTILMNISIMIIMIYSISP
ncbi:MAG: hypothetical protein CL872_03985 [Dehalococcoidaceae bacterium]|nr:hypothetical protein [Dehalococcoidaceae bacterium]